MKRLLPTMAPRLPGILAVLCAAYLAMLPTNNLVWPRSTAFAFMSAAAVLTIATHARDARARFAAGGGVLLAMLAWWLWSTASLAWSIEPRFSVREWETELQYGALVFVSFFVGLRGRRDLRSMLVTLLVAFALLGAGLVVSTLVTGRTDPTRWHHDVGVWSTHLVLFAPLLLFVMAGTDGSTVTQRRVICFAVLLALLLANARLTDNRIVWLAFAVSFGTAAAAAAWRWRSTFMSLPWRYVAPIAALMLLFAFAFADVARERADAIGAGEGSVSTAIEHDPRIALWKAVGERIAEAPLAGHGFGRGILRDVLPTQLNDRALTHPHNTLVGQALETGAVGLALFVLMLGALAWRYLALLRAGDSQLAMTGIVGLSMLAGFVVKNLTDDFFYRSNAKLFWALTAILLAHSIARQRALREVAAESL